MRDISDAFESDVLEYAIESVESEADLIDAVLGRLSGNGVSVRGVEGEAVSVGELFDGLAGYFGPALQRHFGDLFDIIGIPGEPISHAVEPGDLLLTRLLGEGGVAQVSAIIRVSPHHDDTARIDTMAMPSRHGHRTASGKIEPERRTTTLDLRLLPHNQLIIRVRPDGEETSEEVSTGGTAPVKANEFVKFIQRSLNQLLGTNLAVDGIAGGQTRQAIKAFQSQNGLVADGVVGPKTEAVIKAALAGSPSPGGSAPTPVAAGPCPPPAPLPAKCLGLGAKETINCFDFGSAKVLPRHQPQIINIARCIVESQKTATPIKTLELIGHTDPVGSDADNDALGTKRAEAVKAEVIATLKRMTGGSVPGITITTSTRGERDSIPGDAALSRRVEMVLPAGFNPVVKIPPAPRRPAPRANVIDPARWSAIMSSPVLRTGNFVDFLIDGPTTFCAMRDAMLTATGAGHYIYLLGWWLTDDFPIVTPGSCTTSSPALLTIRDLFADRSSRGVQIRAMLWDQAFKSQNTNEVKRISRLSNGAAILDGHTFSSFPIVNVGSHHQKVLVVKGEEGLVAFCGGLDFNPDRIRATAATGNGGIGGSTSSGSSGGAGSPYHDVHCRVVGPAAHDLLDTFIRRWVAHPDHTRIDSSRGNLLGGTEPVPGSLPPRPISSGGTGGNCSVRITRTYTPITPLAPGTSAVRERSVRDTLIKAIQNARRFIYMEEQYLANLEAATLLNAVLPRLDHVTIVIPDSRISDMPRVWEARLKFINILTRGTHGHKARVFFLATPPNKPGTTPVFGPHTYVHAKIWVFDDELAVIGTANCNRRGWTHDSEVNAVMFEDVNPQIETFAQRLRMKLWSEHLNVSPSAVVDGVASSSLWTSPPAGARIRRYDPRADTDSFLVRRLPFDGIDPDAGP